MLTWKRALVVCLAVTMLGAAGAGAPAESELERQVRNPSLDFSHAVELRGLAVELGGGTFEVEQGVLVPAAPVAGRVMEAAFLGKALFRLAPPDEVEAQQLELFTQRDTLVAGIEKAVFVLGGEAVAKQLLDHGPATLDAATQAAARELFDGWAKGAERRGLGADEAIWRAASGDRLVEGYFAASFQSADVGQFILLLDPSETEQVMVGRFVPLSLDDRQKRLTERALKSYRKEGRLLNRRIEDLGDWDTWMKMPLRDPGGRPAPGTAAFEPDHYDLDAKLDPKELSLEGKAVLRLKAVHDGARAVDLDLFDDLTPGAIRDGTGRALTWYRSGRSLQVMLAEPVRRGEAATLEIAYAGVIFNEIETDSFALRDTGGWYPHAGTADRATYKLSLRWPRKYDLMASGKVVDSREEGKEQVETRVLEVPADQVSFEIGKFDVVEAQVGHVKLKVAFNRASGTPPKDAQMEVVETLKKALSFYEDKFGPYPLDQLAVTTVHRDFSQGYLGFLTLVDQLLYIRSPYGPKDQVENFSSRMRIETVAHELAHQWWGNLMGWKSYRDQWLSEALADYSAMLYLQAQSERRSVYLAEHAKGWQRTLRQTTLDGRPLESLGPVVMGGRLNSSLSDEAYQAVVYGKGPLVFAMLARAVGEDKLTLMLKHIVKALANQAIDTETFLASIEKMGSINLGSFSKQFVYGTGIPEIYYSYQFKSAAEGRWEVRGEARQILSPHYRYRLQRQGTGWELSRVEDATRSGDWTLLVPFQVILEPAEGSTDIPKRSDYQTARGLGGTLKVSGGTTPFTFKIDKKPRDFWLDQRGEVLAYFYCSSREPKRTLRLMADQASAEEAEATYKKALAADLLAGEGLMDPDISNRDLKRESRLEDVAIHFGLARWYLDHGRPEDSRKALGAGEELLRTSEKDFWQAERDALHARLDLLRGEYKEAYDRLYHRLYMYFPVSKGEGASAGWRRAQWQGGRLGDAEDYALLAVAAYETSHEKVAQLAVTYAEERGAEMTALKQLLGAKPD